MSEPTFAQRWAYVGKELPGQKAPTWKDLAQAAHKKQLAYKEKDRPEGRPLKHSTTAIEDALRE